MLTTIGDPGAPREVRIVWTQEGATAYLPMSEDPGPDLRLDYSGESRELVLDAICDRIATSAPSALIGLLAGNTVEIATRLGVTRISVSRWRHGRATMGKLRREKVMQALGISKVNNLWVLTQNNA